jgi:hypothetical protein
LSKEKEMMDLDELKQQWTEVDRKLELNIRLNRQLLSASKLNQTQSFMKRLAASLGLELAMWVVIIGALGNFIYNHISQPQFVVSAIALDVYSIGMVILLGRQIAGALQIDYGKPIATIQRQIEALRVLRIRNTQWAVLVGLVVWVAFMIVVMKAAFGVDIFEPAWVWSNVAFGLALIPLAIWLSKKFGDRMERSPFFQGIMRSLAGYNLNQATDFLATLQQFEAESAAG